MKKLLIFGLLILNLNSFGQITKVNLGSTAGDGTGDPLRTAFGKVNTTIDSVNAHSSMLILKAPKANPVFTGVAVLNSMRVGGLGKVLIDSISSDGSNIRFWRGATELTAVPGVGGAAWGSITGTLTDQVDLKNALDAKAPLASPAFTGTPTGITAAHVGAMSTSHAANAITGTNISNWNTAYGWGNHAGLYVPIGDLSGYVPTSRTVNGYALSSNVTLSASDVGLGNVTNESKATMFTSPTFTGTPTVPGYVPTTRTVNGHFLSSNVSVTASDVGLGNVTNESKATMFTSPTFTGTVSGITYSMVGAAAASHTQGQSTITALSDSLLARYTKTQANAKLNLKVNIADTANMLDPYINTTELNDMTDDLSSYAVMKADSAKRDGGYASYGDMVDGLASKANVSAIDTSIHFTTYGYYKNVGLANREFYVSDVDRDGELEELAAAVVVARDYTHSIVYAPSGEYNITAPIILNVDNYYTEIRGNNTFLWVPHAYAGNAIEITSTGDLQFIKISGFRFREIYSGGGYHRNWNGIYINMGTGQDLQMSHFIDLSFMQCNYPIYARVTGTGWINANTFSNIHTSDSKVGLLKTRMTNPDFSGNTFIDCEVQSTSSTTVGIDTLYGEHNTFVSYIYWDASTGGGYGVKFAANSSSNSIIGGSVGINGYVDYSTAKNNYVHASFATAGNSRLRQNWIYATGDITSLGDVEGVTVTSPAFIRTPKNTGNVTAGTGITSAMLSSIILYTGNSAIDISANPQIAAGTNGQVITIMGYDDTNTLKLDDGDGLWLNAPSITLQDGGNITLVFLTAYNAWVQISPLVDN